ncbi:MAG TPA: hypothetical protein RMH99_31820 [Sandaracinaceae bacterium LLY-WYZ-13_1]|nr:hypothetical protein [Sandaracinaceae bacterium LLY-WYZ-13_1]
MRIRTAGRALALVLFMLGCGSAERGDKPVGEPCEDRAECQSGYCVADSNGEGAVCTRTCGSTEECPRGWACSGVTEENVLVCTQGAPTPFGLGARE